MKNKIIAVDFDGTLCENKWPEIGEPNIDLINYLIVEKKKGSRIILWTCRKGERLLEACEWCFEQGLDLDAANVNLEETIYDMGGDTRKIFADVYIDDKFSTGFKLPFKADCPKDKTCGECACYDLCKSWVQLLDYEIDENALGAEECKYFKEKTIIKIYQIHDTYGEWEDYNNVIVGSYLNKEKAEIEKKRLEYEEQKAANQVNICGSCNFSEWMSTEEFERHKEEVPDICPLLSQTFYEGESACSNASDYHEDHNYYIEEINVIE